ncbi:MAG: hypothetical protein SPE36_05465 [Lactobacillus johnsonii]|nr:hypothetical protein [Lactobacillus johnsonii]MDY6042083.1 hypothetical protein [Lactobacillus johnsonii]
MVQKHNSPWDYYTGYIQLYPLDDPAEWIAQVNNRNEDYFDRLDEFSNFPYGVTYAGNLSMDGEWWVGFDTASAPIGSIDEEDCIKCLKQTAKTLELRTKSVRDIKFGSLLEAVNDLANASAFNKLGRKDKVNEKLDEAGKNVVMFLQEELGVAPEDIDLFAILKTALSEDEDDEDE